MKQRSACGVQREVSYAVVDQVRIAYSRLGTGQPVVCLHAIAHGGRDFAAFTDAVCQQYEVITLDWPDHGGSGEDHQPASAARYAQIVIGLLDQLGIQRPIVIGNSIGGAAAILYAQARPVTALVLCDSGGLVAINRLTRGFTRFFAGIFAAGAAGAKWFGRFYRLYYRWMVLPSPAAAEQRARIVAAGSEMAPILRDAWRSFGEPDADLRLIAAGLDVPILAAWARQDRVIPLWMCRPAIGQLQQGRLVTFKAGHAVFLERPAEFVAAFLGFVGEVEGAAERDVVEA